MLYGESYNEYTEVLEWQITQLVILTRDNWWLITETNDNFIVTEKAWDYIVTEQYYS